MTSWSAPFAFRAAAARRCAASFRSSGVRKEAPRHEFPRQSGLRFLASPLPERNETFLREGDENLRRDQLRDFAKRRGGWLIAALRLLLAPPGGCDYLPQR